MSRFDDDADLLVVLTDELTDKRQRSGHMELHLPPLAALQLASILQLVRRTVLRAPPMRTLSGDLLRLIRAYFEDCPTALSVLDAGEPPNQVPDSPRQTTH